ncbi:MAG TPA: branched-chain amino acid ABC transporter permease [Candidatus Angelobacter sp.]|jgi:branched-chain amino acid transport system permease protein|nr:branched-chain amino acid ABC transporter permease [Candidatus Angelobacter sp.]
MKPAIRHLLSQSILPLLLLLALLLLPAAGLKPNVIRLLFITYVWTITSIAWNLVGGFTGQVSFGFAVFYGLGAYTTGLFINAGGSPYLGFIEAAGIAALASFLIGLPTFRLRGPYFAIATIGITEAVRVIMSNLQITGGASGLSIIEHRQFRQVEHYYSALVAVALAVVVSILIARSRFGLALRAIKQDEDAAAALGVNPYQSKLWVHAIAAALTGIAGALHARYHVFIDPSGGPGGVFAFQTGISILLMPVIGGIGTVWGPVLGGMVFGIVEEELVVNFPNFHLLLYGILLILIVLLEPDGLVGLLRKIPRLMRRSKSDIALLEPEHGLVGSLRKILESMWSSNGDSKS